MPADYRVESILVADCGSTMTKSAVVDLVEGQYRLVTQVEVPSTVEAPWEDVSQGVEHAVAQIERASGRILFDEQGLLITPERAGGQGVDAFVITTSAVPPLRIVLAGLVQGLSLASARRAARSIYADVVEVIALDDVTERRSEEERVRLIQQARPDVICIVGGTDGGATTALADLARVVTLACSLLEEEKRPVVIFAGNADMRLEVAQIIGEEAHLKVVDNVRPTLDVENLSPLREEIETIHSERKMAGLPGLAVLNAWNPQAIMTTAQAQSRVIEYLARKYGPQKGVLGVDIGGATTVVTVQLDGLTQQIIRTDLGTSYSVERVLDQVEMDDILRWVPFSIEEGEARNLLLNKSLRPTTLPATHETLLLEQALAREALRLALTEARETWPVGQASPYPHLSPMFEPIVGSGGVLSCAPRPGQAALILLDAIQPIGVSTLVLDRRGFVAAMGAMASVNPLAAVQAASLGGLVNLGTVIAPVGQGREGEIALRLKVEELHLEMDVPYGSLEVYRLPASEPLTLQVRPQRHFDVGWGPGRGRKIQFSGGSVGLIIDARGRPLTLPPDRDRRQAKVQEWLWGMGA
ncbi:MAG: methylaspartate mutase [Chloroflexota bacterium]|nr:MAG: methylaspartate mutase [Chloroflexota bacterium]